ncbi:MAG: O-succinylhomoserine sulfhydrylase [Chromatiales bacterium]|jgi:O-succinylhomoserine sulfhydrylase|nr:O-succinylhomoserine sulfhydrylase [Chromatiales bacterium]
MALELDEDYGLGTRAVRAGQQRTGEGEQSEPIFTTSSFVFPSAAAAAARFSGAEPGNIYSRFTNPTVQTFERRLAALEGAERCVGTASGMAAILAVCMATLKHGDHVVCAHGVFGNTAVLFTQQLARFGVECSFVPLTDLAAWRGALRPNTRMLFVETPANPLGAIADIAGLAEIAHGAGCLLVVDNTVCTACLQQPLKHGADMVVVSATKYIDGQGRCVGGAVLGSEALVGKDVLGVMRTAGMSMSPFNAWVFLKGLETLHVRMRAHSTSALELAQWLREQSAIKAVYYAGFPDHPQRALYECQQEGGGGLVAFELRGGREDAWRFIDAVRLISITANLGDAKTTITHPATTTHGRLTPQARIDAGISDGLVRIAVGLEDARDLCKDLQRGFAAL